MKISQIDMTVKEVLRGFLDKGEDGVEALEGKLDIRPPYQREFVYKDKQRDAVISTILKGHPLNVLYFAVREDGSYEVMDGQQRLISIGQYLNGDYSFEQRSFSNLPLDLQKRIEDYRLFVYLCDGTPSEKLDWFQIINIAGEKLTPQEIRNAVYHGPFVSDAKRWFSKSACPASIEGEGYVSGTPNRQELLEIAIKWACSMNDIADIATYMDKHRRDPTASELWSDFQKVITWAKSCFPKVRKPMKTVDWGSLYSKFGSSVGNSQMLEDMVSKLLMDDEVQNKSGIYSYVFDLDRKHLNLRAFTEQQKIKTYEEQGGLCKVPSYSDHDPLKSFDLEYMEADHITPWSQGGTTTYENCQMLCKDCNRRKSNR